MGLGGNPPNLQLTRFFAEFLPRRADDLNEHAQAFVGQEAWWERLWLIDASEEWASEANRAYDGEWACGLVWNYQEDALPPPIGWVPEGDLRKIEPPSEPFGTITT